MTFSGQHAIEYGVGSDSSYDYMSDISFPYYEGVSLKATLYYFCISLCKIFMIYSKNKSNDKFDVVILTSGIQMLMLLVTPRIFKGAKVILLMQENWRFEGLFFGKLSKYLCSKADLIVSITESWSEKASQFGIKSCIYRNMYNDILSDDCVVREKIFDFIFLGGDQKIKGFNQFVDFCTVISSIKSVKIAVLGEVNSKDKAHLEGVISKGLYNSNITFFGFVNNIFEVLEASKILLLPIVAPHFCRPAIEAGYYKIPFIIRNHPGLSDFVINGYNCNTYDSLDEMKTLAIKLLDDVEYLQELGRNNFLVANKFNYTASSGAQLLESIKNILNEK
jgi:glycosyltransferase involved in cell wall biosynthesis